MKKVLFVCTGNTCRSPMAAALFAAKHSAEVKSAGLFADGRPYCDKSIAALAEVGIDISGGRSRGLTHADLESDVIFCMSASHRDMLLSLGVDDKKIVLLDIQDPFGGDINTYRRCRDEIIQKLSAFEINIRPMVREDIPAVAEIERTCFSHPWSENALCESLNVGTLFFVAEMDGSVIGYAGMQHVLDEAYVTNVAVLPQFRGFGAGKKLTAALVSHCTENNFAFLSLEVRESNETAKALYAAAGFEAVGKRKNFYDDPKEDAIIMTRVTKK